MDAEAALIKSKALELFSKISFMKTSVADIAAACGVGKGTIYLHFQSKDDILVAVIEERLAFVAAETDRFFMDPRISMDVKLTHFFGTLVDEYFAIRDLIFGSFETVKTMALKEVFAKCDRYYRDSITRLVDIVRRDPPWSEQDPTLLKSQITVVVDLIVGRILFFLVKNEWRDKDGLKAIVAPLGARLFNALVGQKTA